MSLHSVYWVDCGNGRHNSVTADNDFEASRRARVLGGKKLFAKRPTGLVVELSL